MSYTVQVNFRQTVSMVHAGTNASLDAEPLTAAQQPASMALNIQTKLDPYFLPLSTLQE